MTKQRDVLKFTPRQFEGVQECDGWKLTTESHIGKQRWYDIWKYVVQNVSTGKFYEYELEVYSGDYYGAPPTEYELTEVFPHTVSTVIYK